MDTSTSMQLSIMGGAAPSINTNESLKQYEIEAPMDIDPELLNDDMTTLIIGEYVRKGSAGDHINSMNSFYRKGLNQIVTELFKVDIKNMHNDRDKTEEDRAIETISINVEFTSVYLTPPSVIKYASREPEMLTPAMAKLKELSYAAAMYITANITATAHMKDGSTKTRTEEITRDDKWRVGSIPVAVKSDLCNLNNATQETLKRLEEDPRNPGGVFIIKGVEWCIDKSENMVVNVMHGYLNDYGREIARGNFQSKPGDAYENSYYIVLRYLRDGQITIQIVTNKYEQLEIPFQLLFRAFGMTRDYDIFDNIVYGVENTDPVTTRMISILSNALDVPNKAFDQIRNSIDSDEVLMFISTKLNDLSNNPKFNKDENAQKWVHAKTKHLLDNFIFPHIGNDPALRIRKLKFLGGLIHDLLRIEMGVLESTDRDAYKNKRIHTAGVSLAKSVKTHFNFAVVQEVRKVLMRSFRNASFNKVPLAETVKSAVNPNDLERVCFQSITTGDKTVTIKSRNVTNRVSSQQVHHKNDSNVKSTLNNITTHGASAAKATDRAQNMRQAHPTHFGYVGMAHSADTGEKVGMNRQMAITSSVVEASSSYFLKDYLSNDPRIIPIDSVQPSDISRDKLTKIFVNGDWIGLCRDAHNIVEYYIEARRHGDINPYTTIVSELLVRKIYFWVDVGRLIRPLVIVYNNRDEFVAKYKAGDRNAVFRQWIKLTKKHIRELHSGTITMDDLRKQRVIEYISEEEHENKLLAMSLQTLKNNVNNPLLQYTHCDIEQAMFGIIELSAPMTNNTPASRITMFTNQKKQTCGWFALNYPSVISKGMFLQHYCDTPTVRALTNSLTYPNAQSAIIAVTSYSGHGQEDSIAMNSSSVKRHLFRGEHYHYEKSELDKGERFGNPDFARTVDKKNGAIYEFCDANGFIKEGTVVYKNCVLIIKTSKLKEPVDNYLYTDRSIVYKSNEPAIVDKVIYPRNEDDVLVAKVRLRTFRPLRVGDKLCLTPSHDVLTTQGWKPIADVSMEDKVATLQNDALVYAHPTKIYKYDHCGDIYEVENSDISLQTTTNHKMYVRDPVDSSEFKLEPAINIAGKHKVYKRTAINKNAGISESNLKELILNYSIYKPLPEYVFTECNRDQARKLLSLYVNRINNKDVNEIVTDLWEKEYHENISRLAILSEYTCHIIDENRIRIIVRNTDIHVNDYKHDDRITSYNGYVHCLEVPDHVFMVKRNGKVSWTGNSSHSGCKGIAAVMMDQNDMPYTEDGTVPDLILNPHSIPTRMVIGQIIETMMGELAIRKGCLVDGTPFKKLDIDSMITELSDKYEIKYGGHRRMFSGKTGEWFDTLIFIGPTSYQRLMKFVSDENYAMSSGPTNALTRQPLDGKNQQGGLRIGEMEKDVLCAHGVIRALFEKFYTDSDGIELAVCRICGERCIINEQIGIYKCNICKDGADIVTVPSSWTSNVFFDTMNAMGVKTQFQTAPPGYSKYE